jgi:hypothetical protein
MSEQGKTTKLLKGAGTGAYTFFRGLNKARKALFWLLVLVLLAIIAGSAAYVAHRAYQGMTGISDVLPTLPGKALIPDDLPKAASAIQLKAMAYTGLADWEGSQVRLNIDLERIMRTVFRINDLYCTDETQIFFKMFELTPPLSGFRPGVPDRRYGFVESEFHEPERVPALAMAEQVMKNPDKNFRGVTLIRPDRKVFWGMMSSLGNQTQAEIDRITDPKGPLVEFVPDGPKGSGEFRWFRLKKESEEKCK